MNASNMVSPIVPSVTVTSRIRGTVSTYNSPMVIAELLAESSHGEWRDVATGMVAFHGTCAHVRLSDVADTIADAPSDAPF